MSTVKENEEKIKELNNKKDEISKSFDAEVSKINNKFNDAKQDISAKTADLLSRQKSELKDLYDELNQLTNKKGDLAKGTV